MRNPKRRSHAQIWKNKCQLRAIGACPKIGGFRYYELLARFLVCFSGENAGCQGFWCPCFRQTHIGRILVDCGDFGMQATSVTTKIDQWILLPQVDLDLGGGVVAAIAVQEETDLEDIQDPRESPNMVDSIEEKTLSNMKYQVLGSINWMHPWWGRIFWQLWVHVGLPSGYGPIHIILLGMPGGSGWCGVAWWQLRWLSTLGEHRSGPSRKALTIQNQARGM